MAFIVILCFSVFGGVFQAEAATQLPTAHGYVRLFYYKETKTSHADFITNWKYVDILAPQTYAFDASGKLQGSVNATVLSVARKHSIKVMPLVTNASFGQQSLSNILDNEAIQSAVIEQLVSEAKKNNYWGWEIDFEQMDASYRDRYSAFIKKMGTTFRAHKLKLSVSVIAQVSNNPADYPNNLWQRIIGVYDYAALAPNVDFISLMSYDDPNSKGPIAGNTWLNKTIQYALLSIPKDKLSLGVGLYYWEWDTGTQKRTSIGGYSDLEKVIKKYTANLYYSSEEQAPFMNYVIDGEKYMTWYENAESIQSKVALIKSYGLQGFSAWRLGLEDPSIYSVLK